MEYLLADEKLEPEARLKLVALAYARAKYETLMQVLELISIAKDRGLGLGEVEGIIADWLTEVDAIYRDIICSEELFNLIIRALKLAEEVRRAKAARAKT